MMEDAARMKEGARAAMRAIAGTVADAPPLHLPPSLGMPEPGVAATGRGTRRVTGTATRGGSPRSRRPPALS